MYSKDHTWGTKINYYSIIPDCCESPSISSERYPDSSYNQPCSMDADELAMFEHYGSPKVCILLRMFVRVLGLMLGRAYSTRTGSSALHAPAARLRVGP